MKIYQPISTPLAIDNKLIELDLLIKTLENNVDRPCPGCVFPCSCSNSLSCNCDCNAKCPKAPTQLSSEQGRYPIEGKVLPLVFTLRQMDVCEPCWSCEGHLDEKQQLNKIPQVWFHSSSMCLLRLMDECLSQFKVKKLLHYTWEIAVSFSGQECIDNAFTLKPDLNTQEHVELSRLHKDLEQIADNLADALLSHSKRYQITLQKMKTKLAVKVI